MRNSNHNETLSTFSADSIGKSPRNEVDDSFIKVHYASFGQLKLWFVTCCAFRFGVFAQGAIGMFYRKSSFGFTYQLNNSMFIPLENEFKLDLEKQKLTEMLQLPKERKALIKTRYLTATKCRNVNNKRLAEEAIWVGIRSIRKPATATAFSCFVLFGTVK